jgi:hypothetical protein
LDVPVISISLNKTTAVIGLGSTDILIPRILPTNATNRAVEWSSGNEAIVEVNEVGQIKGLLLGGPVRITVTTVDGGLEAHCDVTVVLKPVTGVSLNKTSTSLMVGNSEMLIATIEPDDADVMEVTWSSDLPSTVSVEANGRISALAEGTAIITVTTISGGYTANCTVNAIKPTVYEREIFVAGNIEGEPVYWKNGRSIKLVVPADHTAINNAIFVTQTDVYNIGTIFSPDWNRETGTGWCKPALWVNDADPVLYEVEDEDEDNLEGTDVFVDGSDVYVLSQSRTYGYFSRGKYWKNGAINELEAIGWHDFVNRIIVKDGDVYVVGEYSRGSIFDNQPCIWINGAWVELSIVGNPADCEIGNTTSIALAGTDVYVSGILSQGWLIADGSNDRVSTGVFWENGNMVHPKHNDALVAELKERINEKLGYTLEDEDFVVSYSYNDLYFTEAAGIRLIGMMEVRTKRKLQLHSSISVAIDRSIDVDDRVLIDDLLSSEAVAVATINDEAYILCNRQSFSNKLFDYYRSIYIWHQGNLSVIDDGKISATRIAIRDLPTRSR